MNSSVFIKDLLSFTSKLSTIYSMVISLSIKNIWISWKNFYWIILYFNKFSSFKSLSLLLFKRTLFMEFPKWWPVFKFYYLATNCIFRYIWLLFLFYKIDFRGIFLIILLINKIKSSKSILIESLFSNSFK